MNYDIMIEKNNYIIVHIIFMISYMILTMIRNMISKSKHMISIVGYDLIVKL